MPISEFWNMTPYELGLTAKGYSQRKEMDQKESIYHAYLISRWVWQKRIDIEKILKHEEKKKEMTDDEMLQQAMKLNAMFGGVVKHG